MINLGFTVVLLLLSVNSYATDKWLFSEKTAVTRKPQAGVFLHLDGSNRKHIAVSQNIVLVVWEDDHSSDPQVYLSYKERSADHFSKQVLVSSGTEAYEPAVANLSNDGFVVTWEQDAAVYARLFINKALITPPIKLSKAVAGHATVITLENKVYIAWREQIGREWFLKVAFLKVSEGQQLSVIQHKSVEVEGIKSALLYPALAVSELGLSITWEDRRAGHTRLMFSYSSDQAQSFSEPQYLNEFYSNRNEFDKGNGVTRVSIAAFAEDELIAAWMDKRRGENGYGIFSALGADWGPAFGPNERVHSQFGDNLPHYNPATAGNKKGDFVVVWDDYRHGNSDIWMSSYDDDSEWTEDYTPAIASGEREQSHPAISLDEQGNLHMIWMDRFDLNSPAQIWYSSGKLILK